MNPELETLYIAVLKYNQNPKTWVLDRLVWQYDSENLGLGWDLFDLDFLRQIKKGI